MSVEDMIKRSFSEFATQRAVAANDYPKLLTRGRKALAKLDDQFEKESSLRIGAEDIDTYFALSSQLLNLNSELQGHILMSPGSGGGGAVVIGRVVLVTSARRHGYVRAPAIVLRPPSPSVSKSAHSSASSLLPASMSGESSTDKVQSTGFNPAVCLVLLPYDYQSKTEDNKLETGRIPIKKPGKKAPTVSSEIGTLNYIGTSHGRHYAIHETELTEIFLVSTDKQSIDSKSIFKDISNGGSSGLKFPGGGETNDPFFGMAPRASTRDDDNPFFGLVPRDKKVGGGGAFTSSSSRGGFDPTQYHRHVDKIVSLLLDVEAKESTSSLGILDLRTITPGVQKGEDYLSYRSACDRMEDLVHQCRYCQSHSHPNLASQYIVVERKEVLRARVKQLQHVLSNESLSLFPDFLQRKTVLRTIGYVDANDTVCMKGRVACEVNTCESVIATELIFEGILNELEPAEIVAALSALLTQEKSMGEEVLNSELPESLTSCCHRMKTIAYNLGVLQKEHGLLIVPSDYVDEVLQFGLVHVVYEWALGVPFCNICELTLVQEGSIVRCITRLDELCREVRNCARVVGNPTLYRKMEAASVAIKRDIVFASSLYVN